MDQATLPRALRRGNGGGGLDPVFALETYESVEAEIRPMLPEHWAELAVHHDIPLDPDYDLYQRMSAAGVMLFYTARSLGELIGYAIFTVAKNPHYRRHTWAVSDILWVHPSFRQIGVGRAFMNFWDGSLRARGVDVVHVNAKVAAPALMYLLKDGDYATTECGMEKRL